MRTILAIAMATALGAAATGSWAQEKYTNADLDRIYVPGAFTNEDLKALPPLEVQRAPAQPLTWARIDTTERDLLLERVRALEERRAALVRELAYEEELVRRAEGPGGNSPYNPHRSHFVGYRSKSQGLRAALRKEIALLGEEVEEARWHALRAPVTSLR